jgi:hypothetical protein
MANQHGDGRCGYATCGTKPKDRAANKKRFKITRYQLTTSSLAIFDPVEDKQWNQIIEKIISDIDAEDENIPDKVTKAVECLLAGFSINDAAKYLEVSPRTIRRWINRYPAIPKVLANHQTSLAKWRMARLERQLLKALECSERLLDIDPSEKDCSINEKILSAQAMHSRFIINLFTGQKIDVHVTHDIADDLKLKASQGAMEYIASRTAELLRETDAATDTEPIDATFRVEGHEPLQAPTGGPNFGITGVLDTDMKGTQCHICGKRYKYLRAHVQETHSMSPTDYEIIYMLEPGSL